MAADHGWPMVKLGDLGRFASGGTPNRKREEFYQGETPWISSADISEDGKITARRFITDEAIAKSATTEVPAGTLLVAVRIGVGKTAITTSPTCFSQDVVALLDTDPNEVSTGFLQHLITWLRPHLEQIARGVTIKGITIGDLKDLNIPLPPLAEQRRIAELLDRSVSQVQATKQLRSALSKAKSDLFSTLFHPDRYTLTTLGTVSKVISGGTPRTTQKEYWDGEIPWITPADLGSNIGIFIERGNRCITELGLKKSSAELIPENSVILSSRAPIGYIAINTRPITTNQGCKSFVPKRDELDAGYLAHYLLNIRDHLQQMGSGATFKELSRARSEEIPMALPPLNEQRWISNVLGIVAALEPTVAQKLALFEELHASLSARAFAGKL